MYPPPATETSPRLPMQSDRETETSMGSGSRNPNPNPNELDSLEPAGPKLPEMNFPYQLPDEQSAPQDSLRELPQNSLKPALPVSKPTLGVMGQPVEGWGFAVQSVLPNSPAARMRLEPGDVILSVNGERVCSANSITSQLLYSDSQQSGTGVLVIDNVRFRSNVTVRTCRGSYSRPSKKRFQKIRFQL